MTKQSQSVPRRPRRIVRFLRSAAPDGAKRGIMSLLSTLSATMSNPEFLVVFSLIFFLTHTTYSLKESSPVGTVLSYMINDKNSASFGCFCLTNIAQFFGILAFIPALLYSPDRTRGIVFVFAIMFIYVFPNRTNYTAVIQGMLTFLFVRTRGFKPRVILITAMAIAYFVQTGVPFETVKFTQLEQMCAKVKPAAAAVKDAPAADAIPSGICVQPGAYEFKIMPEDGRCRIDYNTGSKWKTYKKECMIRNNIAYFPSFDCLNGFDMTKSVMLDKTFLDYVSIN